MTVIIAVIIGAAINLAGAYLIGRAAAVREIRKEARTRLFEKQWNLYLDFARTVGGILESAKTCLAVRKAPSCSMKKPVPRKWAVRSSGAARIAKMALYGCLGSATACNDTSGRFVRHARGSAVAGASEAQLTPALPRRTIAASRAGPTRYTCAAALYPSSTSA